MPTLWGEGLHTRHFWRGVLGLRRNSLVYEVTLSIKNTRMTFVFYRKKSTKHNR